MTKLTSEAVDALVRKCLFTPEEAPDGDKPIGAVIPDGAIIVDGIVRSWGFHAGRVAEAANAIGDLLAELPDEFHASKGGGWSFLNACNDRHGQQWGEHRQMEALFCLGIAAGKARWLMERDMWDAFPGGMPYVVVL